MKYSLNPLKENNQDAEKFFQEIDAIYAKHNNDPNVFDVKKQVFHDDKATTYPLIIIHDKVAVGITWVRLTTPYYGNLTLYTRDKKHIYPSLTLIKEKGYFDKKMIEIVAINHLDEMKQICFDLKLTPNIRKRMYLWLNELNEDYVNAPVKKKYEIKPYTKDLIEWSAKLSVESHKISKDYEMYEEMIHVEKRKKLEEVVFNGIYGDILESASLVLSVDNTLVGYCLVVLVGCWGYKQVPWVFDICIDPAYQGNGYGKLLANELVKKIKQDQFEIMGLAVTLSNMGAINIYQKQGVRNLDIFYEFTNVMT